MSRATCRILAGFAIFVVLIATQGIVAQTASFAPAVLRNSQAETGEAQAQSAADSLSSAAHLSNASTQISIGARRKVIMSLVVDRSGSMTSDGGSAALESAVPMFVSQFNNLFDEVALVSFADNGEVDVPIGFNFISPITNAIAAMPFYGGTFGTGAGSQPLLSPTAGAPMSLADAQNNSIVVTPPQQVVKVLVYFTDGLMNTVQDNFNCPNQVLLNYGGFDSQGGQYGDIFDPNSKTTIFGTATPSGFPYKSGGSNLCKDSHGNNVTTFTSQIDGSQKTFLQANITPEAEYRAIYTANAMRTESPIPTYIYMIGLGTAVNPTTQAFLAQLANDPAYPTYIPTQTAGEFFYIPDCPSPTCTNELKAAFQAIATKLLHG